MEEFNALIEVAQKLLGPQGCPWDHTQTFLSLRPYVLEEAHEVVEAVDEGNDAKMVEELGDLLYTVIFYATLAEKEGRFSLREILKGIKEKLVRRHPHVFGEIQVSGADEVIQNWERIKKEEKKGRVSTNFLEDLPPTMSLLMKAQKVLRKIQRIGSDLYPNKSEDSLSEEALGSEMLALILRAENGGIDAESALRRALSSVISDGGAKIRDKE